MTHAIQRPPQAHAWAGVLVVRRVFLPYFSVLGLPVPVVPVPAVPIDAPVGHIDDQRAVEPEVQNRVAGKANDGATRASDRHCVQ